MTRGPAIIVRIPLSLIGHRQPDIAEAHAGEAVDKVAEAHAGDRSEAASEAAPG